MNSNVLIILSASRAFDVAVDYICSQYSIDGVDVLTTKGASVSPSEKPVVSQVWELSGKQFSIKNLDDRVLKELRDRQYDHVFVLCNEIHESGYENVEELANKITPGKSLAIDTWQRTRGISEVGKFWAKFKNTLNRLVIIVIWVGIWVVLAVGVLFLMFLGIVFSVDWILF